ncbi:MAG: pantoate--beta-alanine ligase [Methylococcales bacterium]|jgi:pantoate--beta-alanine ligase|nr:pantoate--beta-alanine ligase [Methylococcales bacterium]
MQQFQSISDVRAAIHSAKAKGSRIGLVPTMGNLHEGHLNLVEQAKSGCDYVVVSIFVNPTQFSAGEDFDQYPRTLTEDIKHLESQGVDCLFAPSVTEMYPRQSATQVLLPELSNILCGLSRPGHFDGVGLVVGKLFNILMPDCAYFGLKDYQQCLLIQRMVIDLNFPVEIQLCETIREHDGLAKSSRNQYLSELERVQAPALYQSLLAVKDALKRGLRQYAEMESEAVANLTASGFVIDYFHIKNPNSLSPSEVGDESWQVIAAAFLGKARLIDNIAVSAKECVS